MANLKPLIRYRKHLIDEKQKVISQLFREIEQVEQQKRVILAQMQREMEIAEDMGTAEAASFLGLYLEGARKKVQALDATIKRMEARIQAAQEELRAAFAEMKKVEIVQRNREDAEKQAEKKKDDARMDEIAIERFGREDEA